MHAARVVFSILVCATLIVYSQENASAHSDGNTFDRVRYNGGTVSNGVDPKDWGNHLSVTSDAIIFTFKNGETSTINPKSVTSLSYGQEAHRRVGTMVALAILVAPVALFGLFHKTRLHFIGIQYKKADGKSAGLLLQGDKDNYRAILVALQSVSGVPVTVSDKDREYIPVGVTADVSRSSGPVQTASDKTTPVILETRTGTVNLVSVPDGADIYVDDEFVGNSPATLKLKVGKRIISARKSGFGQWRREINISDGTVSLNAELLATGDHQDNNSDPQTASAPANPSRNDEQAIGWIGLLTRNDEKRRVAVEQVAPRSPAAINGIKAGDFITQLNGIPVKSKEQFDVAVASCRPGSQIRLAYVRNTWQAEATMVVGRE
jgi:PDZ domain/PEGA domain